MIEIIVIYTALADHFVGWKKNAGLICMEKADFETIYMGKDELGAKFMITA